MPDEHGELSSEMYKPRAIRAARAAPGSWEVKYFVLFLGWLISFFTFWLGWQLVRSLRAAGRAPKAGGSAADSRGGGG